MYKNLDIKSLGLSGTQSEMIELALSYRFQGMSIDLASFYRQVEEHGLPHARRLIDSARIKIASFRLPFALHAADADGYRLGLAELPKMAEVAQALGCTRCIAAVQPASDERPYHENFEFHRKRISEVNDVLKQHDVRLGLEFQAPAALRKGRAFQFIHAFDGLLHLAKAASNVGVVVDLWQMHLTGAGVEEIKALRPEQIVAVYLSDVAEDADLEAADDAGRLLPGETGTIDSAAALTTLAELGYEGPVTPRAYRKAIEEQSRDAIVRLASQRLEEIWKTADLDASGKLSAASRLE